MLRDVEYFTARLGRIDGFGDAGEYLSNIVKSRQVESASPATASCEGGAESEESPADKTAADAGKNEGTAS